MKGIIVTDSKAADNPRLKKISFKNDIFSSIKAGLIGLTAFFTIIIISKFIGFIIGASANFTVKPEDFLTSLLGFILAFLIKFFENYNQRPA